MKSNWIANLIWLVIQGRALSKRASNWRPSCEGYAKSYAWYIRTLIWSHSGHKNQSCNFQPKISRRLEGFATVGVSPLVQGHQLVNSKLSNDPSHSLEDSLLQFQSNQTLLLHLSAFSYKHLSVPLCMITMKIAKIAKTKDQFGFVKLCRRLRIAFWSWDLLMRSKRTRYQKESLQNPFYHLSSGLSKIWIQAD